MQCFLSLWEADWCFDSGLHLSPGGTGLYAHFFEKPVSLWAVQHHSSREKWPGNYFTWTRSQRWWINVSNVTRSKRLLIGRRWEGWENWISFRFGLWLYLYLLFQHRNEEGELVLQRFQGSREKAATSSSPKSKREKQRTHRGPQHSAFWPSPMALLNTSLPSPESHRKSRWGNASIHIHICFDIAVASLCIFWVWSSGSHGERIAGRGPLEMPVYLAVLTVAWDDLTI